MKTQGKIDEFVKMIREASPDNVVSFQLFINSEGHDLKQQHRTAEDLKSSGISMRNLKGDFIQ